MHELDAASNNKVEAMRDLIEKAALGTPGRHRVYILDEVHMLTPAAEAALLKTLEEPPSHVVFVLATTDPQKVRDTIRSRTQHLRFHLLPADELVEHVRWVAADAGLDVDEAAIEAAVAQGGGSARDTLSALELIANTGGDAGDALSFDELMEALIDRDAGRALTAMAHAVNAGHEPRPLAEAFVRHLRDGFLSLLAPELVQRSSPQVDALAAQAQRLGPAALVRAIERLGEILVELRHAPRPARARRGRARAADQRADGRHGRRHRPAGRPGQPRWSRRSPTAQAAAPAAPKDPATGRTELGGRARPGCRRRHRRRRPRPAPPAPESAPARRRRRALATWAPSGTSCDRRLRGIAKAVFAAVELDGVTGDTATFAAPNAAHRAKCDDVRADVEAAWRAATGHARTGRGDHQGRPGAAIRARHRRRPDDDDRPRRPRRRRSGQRAHHARPAGRGLPRLAARRAGRVSVASAYSPPVQTLIDELGRLPGIGPKSAQRIAFHLLKIPADDVARLSTAINEAKARVRFCARCFNVTDTELCSFCTRRSARRDASCAWSRSRATSSPSSAPASSTAATTSCSGR